ncbi:GTP-binding nuclear protein GSP1/CNR1-like [Helianthus annuus]|uniref:GTP-binding nuclear protein GSP1/CNR1-like n=1 Tax=Helianthus annuus TaxID=4232 RepID=UPI000B8FEEE3|nr:GTP-binding nuclear protein GSP1/CNR1-like [Helianthus annuus]
MVNWVRMMKKIQLMRMVQMMKNQEIMEREHCHHNENMMMRRFAIHDMEFATNIEDDAIPVECVDRHGGYDDCYEEALLAADCIMIMIDVTNLQSFERLEFWINTIYRIAGISFNPIVIVGNKVDSNERIVEPHMVAARSTLQYYEVSALANHNYEQPFVYLLQQYWRLDLQLEVALRLANPQAQIVPVAPAAAPPAL